jgi:hypothetical protein
VVKGTRHEWSELSAVVAIGGGRVVGCKIRAKVDMDARRFDGRRSYCFATLFASCGSTTLPTAQASQLPLSESSHVRQFRFRIRSGRRLAGRFMALADPTVDAHGSWLQAEGTPSRDRWSWRHGHERSNRCD